MRFAALLALATLSGCLRIPPPPERADAGPGDATLDAGEPPGLALAALEVSDLGGVAWPSDAMPRRPVITMSWTTAPRIEDDTPPPVWLLRGSPDDDLLDDLATSPLRSETRSRAVAATLVPGARRWELRVDERFEGGAELTLAIGAWLRADVDDEPIDAPMAIPLRVSEEPEAGASVAATWPPDGAMAVSPSLRELAILFDGPLSELADGSIALLEGDRVEECEVARVECSIVGWSDGWCVRVVPGRPLRRGSAHRIAIDARLLDATRAPVGPFEARFTTSLDEMPVAPSPRVPAACALDEAVSELGCVLVDDERVVVRVDAGEPVRWTWSLGVAQLRGVAPRGAALLRVAGLSPETELEGHLTLEGTSGAITELDVWLSTTEPLAALSIVEVRPDPHGPEPTQEYVELLNYGAVPLTLDGFTLSDRDDAIGDVLAGSVAPGERVLVVADRFDPDDPADPTVPPGVRLVRLEGPIGSGGLSNAGEPLYLRDPMGRRVSSAPALTAAPGTCVVRTGASMRDDEGFGLAPCSPGIP